MYVNLILILQKQIFIFIKNKSSVLKHIQNSDIKILKEKISNSNKILLIGHRNPDGDAIGSALGFYHILKNMGKDVNVLMPNDFPLFLKWLKDAEKIYNYEVNVSDSRKIISESDLLIFVDFNELSRIECLENEINKTKAFKVLIDHHPNPSNFCDLTFSTTDVSSTAELIYLIIEKLELTTYLNFDSAESLFTGLMTDTVLFSVNSFRPSTFKVASSLISFGVEFDKIKDLVFNDYSFDRMKLLGHCLSNKMKMIEDCSTAYISINKKEIYKFNFKKGDSEGFVNYPLSIRNVKISALFIEKKDHIKISFRSKGDIKINEFASLYFNGGGHKNAAGGESYDTLNNTLKKFKKLLPKFLNKNEV